MSLLSTSVTLPSLRPRLVDPLWLKLDEPKDDAWQLNCAQRWHDEALSEVANRKAPIAIGLNLLNRQGNGDENGEGSSGDEDADASDEAADGSDTSGTQDPQDDVEMGESAIGQ